MAPWPFKEPPSSDAAREAVEQARSQARERRLVGKAAIEDRRHEEERQERVRRLLDNSTSTSHTSTRARPSKEATMSPRSSQERLPIGCIAGPIAAVVVIALIGGIVFWTQSRGSSATNETCVVYNDGPLDQKTYRGILEPGSTNVDIGFASKTYCYQNDQRSFIGSADPGADAAPVSVVGKGDGAEDAAGQLAVSFDYNLYFTLNTDPKVLRAFHEEIGKKTNATSNEGWNEMLRDYLRPQIVRAMQNAAGKYSYIDLYSDPATKAAYQQDVIKLFKTSLTEVLNGDYFCRPGFDGTGDCGDITFTVGNPQLPEAIQKSIEGEIQARRDTAKQAEENRRTEKALEAEKMVIDLYGQDNAIIYRALERGGITFWVLPDGTSVPAPTRNPESDGG